MGLDEAVEQTPGVLQQEIDLTVALLKEMNQKAKERGVPFAVILLPFRHHWPLEVIAVMGSEGIPFLDLSRMKTSFFPHDNHPDATGHIRIAHMVAKSFISDLVPGGLRRGRARR